MMRGTDALGLLLLAGLAALAVGVGAALIEFGFFKPWELALFLFVGIAFVAVGLPSHGTPAPKNSKVHGAAAPAAEQEALAAARGQTKTARMHDQQFLD
jgi:membrane protein implicated in regulation of membrane protease activity